MSLRTKGEADIQQTLQVCSQYNQSIIQILDAFKEKKITLVIFIDLRKVFDRVCFDILLKKLDTFDIK